MGVSVFEFLFSERVMRVVMAVCSGLQVVVKDSGFLFQREKANIGWWPGQRRVIEVW